MVDFNCILLSLDDLEEAQAITAAREQFKKHYCGGGWRGEMTAHDGARVVFFEDRFEHAFYSSANRSQRPKSKEVFSKTRACRMLWIEHLIKGLPSDCECYECDGKTGRSYPPNRFYAARSLNYVVWLEPLGVAGGYRFSSAYLPFGDMTRYIRMGRKLWPPSTKS